VNTYIYLLLFAIINYNPLLGFATRYTGIQSTQRTV